MELWDTLCPISCREWWGRSVQTSSATSNPLISTVIHNLYTMSWNIYIFVHFTSTINMSIFSNFLEGRVHFPGDFSELHMPLLKLGKFLNEPNTNCSKPGLDLRSVLLLLFILKSRKMKSGKRDKQEHLIHSFFTDHADTQFPSCAFLYHPRNQTAFISTCMYPTSTHVPLGGEQVLSSGLIRNENYRQRWRRSLLQITIRATTSCCLEISNILLQFPELY